MIWASIAMADRRHRMRYRLTLDNLPYLWAGISQPLIFFVLPIHVAASADGSHEWDGHQPSVEEIGHREEKNNAA
jgi:hypothetical protein